MPKLQWRNLRLALEQFAKRLRIFKTKLIRDFAHRQGGCRQNFLRFFDQFVVDVLLGALARQVLNRSN